MDVVIDYFLIILRSRKTCLILNDMCRDAVICRSSRKYVFVSQFFVSYFCNYSQCSAWLRVSTKRDGTGRLNHQIY